MYIMKQNTNTNNKQGSNQNNNQNTNKNNNQIDNYELETKTTVMNLEKLKLEYKSQLTAYKQAVADYINFLQQNSTQPCIQYSADSKEIDQKCYDDIWKKAGCTTTGAVNASSDWSKSQTLNGLIYDAFLWATMTDSEHRNGCYGSTTDTSVYSTAINPDYNINKSSYAVIKGQTFWGSGQASKESVYTDGTIEQCEAKCAETSNCTGATFNPSSHGKSMCWLRTGEGELMPGMDKDFAIVPEAKKYLLIIESINKKLLETNTKIQIFVEQGQPLYNSIKTKAISQNNELTQNYQELVMEREKIEKMLSSYQDLDKRETNGNLKINQKYYTFVLLTIVTICIIILLYKFSSIFSNAQSSTNYIQQGGQIDTAFNVSGLIIIISIIFIFYFTTIKNTSAAVVGGIFGIFGSFFNMIGGIFSINDDY
jgi:hypothetical protein